MNENYLIKLFEHNHWANQQIIRACAALSDEQLDEQPHTATKGTIRQTLIHLVQSQRGYLALLTLPVSERPAPSVNIADQEQHERESGQGLIALAKGEIKLYSNTRLQTKDGYLVDPWVVLLQAINHATEHREQINSMLTALGVTPPDLDGWAYGEATKALTPIQ